MTDAHSHETVDSCLVILRQLRRLRRLRRLRQQAIIWHEMWHERLEEASRLWFGPLRDADGMVAVLEPLHLMLEQGPETLREVSFRQSYGRELTEAWQCLRRFKQSRREKELAQALLTLLNRVSRSKTVRHIT